MTYNIGRPNLTHHPAGFHQPPADRLDPLPHLAETAIRVPGLSTREMVRIGR